MGRRARFACASVTFLVLIAAACVSPPPEQIVLEIRDPLGIAADSVASLVSSRDDVGKRSFTPEQGTIAFPFTIAMRGDGQRLVTIEALDANDTPIAWASRGIEFGRQDKDSAEHNLYPMDLASWMPTNCKDTGDCPAAAACAVVACEPLVLAIGVCRYAPIDSTCAATQYCDVELGCLNRCTTDNDCTDFDVCDEGDCAAGLCTYGEQTAADGTACANGTCAAGRCEP